MKADFPGLLRDKTAAGTRRWRVRVEGQPNKKIKIPVGPGQPGFEEYYFAARAGQKTTQKETFKPTVKNGSLDDLASQFVNWMEGQVKAGNLSRLTLAGRRTNLRQACDVLDHDGDRMGDLDANLPEEAFTHILDSYGQRTGAAETCLKALRAAYRWGQKRGFPKHSAVFEITSDHKPKGGAKRWTPQDIIKFLAFHPSGSMARLWLGLADTTAGRIGDMNRLGPSHEIQTENGRCIDYQPAKKGSRPVTLVIQTILAAELRHHDLSNRDTYLVTQKGEPFASPGSLGNRVRAWVVQAGLHDEEGKSTRSQHGVRKAVAVAMAEGGATTYEIMAQLGHVEAKTTEVYTRDVGRVSLAASGRARAKDISFDPSGPRHDERGPHWKENLIKSRDLEAPWQPVGESNPSFQVENLTS